MTGRAPTLILPDAGPLITLAYADALDLLLKPGWPVWIVDMVLHEVTRNATPTSQAIAAWVSRSGAVTRATRTFTHYRQRPRTEPDPPRKAGLGELAIQETMHELALMEPPPTGVFLFEDHKIARASFLVPANCYKVSTRAFLWYLQDQGWLESAAEVERRAILKGRQFSKLRFPAGDA